MKHVVFLAIAVSLFACSSPKRAANSADEIVATFACTTGENLTIRFLPSRRVAVVVRNGESAELAQQPSGSGYRYGNGWTNIRGKGRALTLEVGKAAPLECQAQ